MKLIKYPLHRVRMEQVQVRLSPEIRKKAKEIAANQSDDNTRYRESDVYRTAITLFLSGNFTISKDEQES